MSDLLDFGRDVLRQEAAALERLASGLDASFDAALERLLGCSGHVVVTGIGKPWLIGQKLSATLASTGTPSFALHPAEAMHGDLGRLRADDVVIAMSNSGASEELLRLVPELRRVGCALIALTGARESPLAQAADVVVDVGRVREACPIGMAPSVSTTALLALGDALALALMKARNFSRADYARFHPGGALGRSLMTVAEVMRSLDETAVVDASADVTAALDAITQQRTGAAFVTRESILAGVFTDGDLRRLVRSSNLLTQNVAAVMTADCRRIVQDALATDAVALFERFRIGELPVVDADDRLLGHVSLKDLVAMHFV
ncbi:MAG: KpsF/GutQ family sugar-phosphate isomerase [Pseudomonadota bacterium]